MDTSKAQANGGVADADACDQHRPPRWYGVLIGLVAAGLGLAFGELVAGFSRALRSPVVSVGDRVIDRVPKFLEDFAKRTFGPESDKTVLRLSILVVIAIAAALVGIATVRGRRSIGIASASAFGLLGALAAGVGRNTRFVGVVPSLVAAAVAGGVLVFGHRLAHPEPVVASARPHQANSAQAALNSQAAPTVDRRRFLTTTGGLAVGALLVTTIGKSLQGRFDSSLVRAGVRLPKPVDPLPPPPSDLALLAGNEGLSSLITPIKSFYRIDTALSFPSVALSSWRMKVTGKVDNPLTLSYDDILNRTLIERDITISCVSNEVGGDLVGNARWIGCRLDDLLKEAGVHSDADQVLGVSVDGFTAGFPVTTLDGRDALIAVGMNGEALPVRNGFPARIIVPGIYGYVSAVKWLSEIRLTRFDTEEGYWVPRGWATLAPVKTQSRIDRPGGNVKAGATHLAGIAWAPTRGIDKAEIQVDDGPWMETTLGPSLGNNSWRQWWLQWDAPAGRHQIRVRATDGTGETQTEQRTQVAPDGASGWHTIRVDVSA